MTPIYIWKLGNRCSVRLTRSVRRRAASFKSGTRKLEIHVDVYRVNQDLTAKSVQASIGVHGRQRCKAIETEPNINHANVTEHEVLLAVIPGVGIFAALVLERVNLRDEVHVVTTLWTGNPRRGACLDLIRNATKFCFET